MLNVPLVFIFFPAKAVLSSFNFLRVIPEETPFLSSQKF